MMMMDDTTGRETPPPHFAQTDPEGSRVGDRAPLMADVDRMIAFLQSREAEFGKGVAVPMDAETFALLARIILGLSTALRDQDRRVAQLTAGPQFFAVTGLVDADLAERYESLKAAHATVQAERDAAIKLHRADLLEWRSLWRPHDVDALIERRRAGEELDGAETAEIALWSMDRQGRAIRFVAELATMTDIEAEFINGDELRSVARLLQVPDMDGEVEATLPRLYGEEDRDRAIAATHRQADPINLISGLRAGMIVDAVALALGMRRAGA
jgi:hypothetical protein